MQGSYGSSARGGGGGGGGVKEGDPGAGGRQAGLVMNRQTYKKEKLEWD